MDERHLLLLGILMTENLHGYHITEFIERNLSRIIALKKTTAYSILDKMVKQGHLSMSTEQAGKRPQRKVYSITSKGEEAFNMLLLDNLGRLGDMNLPQEVGITFIDHLPRSTVLAQFEKKHDDLIQTIERFEAAPSHLFGIGAELAIDHRLTVMRAELQWLRDVVQRLQKEVSEEC